MRRASGIRRLCGLGLVGLCVSAHAARADFECAVATGVPQSASPGGADDADYDGLHDGWEDTLLDCFAPELRFDQDERYFLEDPAFYARRATLKFDHDGEGEGQDLCDDDVVIAAPEIGLEEDGSSGSATLTSQRRRFRDGDLAGWYGDIQLERCGESSFEHRSGAPEVVGSFGSRWRVLRPDGAVAVIGDVWPHFPRAAFAESQFYLTISDALEGGSLPRAEVYGHVRRAPGHHPGMFDVQYWLFYAYNGDVWATGGNHEADWEHVTVRVELGQDGMPRMHAMFFAAHKKGLWADPDDLEANPDGRPVVYVARYTHASYPTPGRHSREAPGDDLIGYGDLNANGRWDPLESPHFDARGRVRAIGERRQLKPGMSLMNFSGRWGRTEPIHTLSPSPEGPLYKDRWDDDGLGDIDSAWHDSPDRHPWVFVSANRGDGGGDGSWSDPYDQTVDLDTVVPAGWTAWLEYGTNAYVGVLDFTGSQLLSTPMTLGAVGRPVVLDR